MRFDLVDRVVESAPGRIVTIKAVSAAEEYLADHFPTFPVLPGVLMLEAMVQAARCLAELHRDPSAPPLVLGRVRALKYGRFVKPGDTIRVEVCGAPPDAEGALDCRGQVLLPQAGAEPAVAASGRFTLRPLRPFGAGAG